MDTTLYVALSQQTALQRQMDIVANNIANLDTTGFRRETAIFQQYLAKESGEAIENLNKVNYVTDGGVYRDNAQGNFTVTGGTFDLALQGKGYFQVRAKDGQIHYTRNGSFSVNDDGTLVNTTGSKLLDDSGAPIQIAPEDVDVRIAKDGTIASKRGQIATLGFVEFANDAALQRTGNNEYSTTQTPQQSPSTQVLQGKLEASNVNGVLEITNLIKIQRQYETTARMIEDYQKLRSNSINRLSEARSA